MLQAFLMYHLGISQSECHPMIRCGVTAYYRQDMKATNMDRRPPLSTANIKHGPPQHGGMTKTHQGLEPPKHA